MGLLLAGCRKVEPAPEDLDGLFHYFWQSYEAREDKDGAPIGEDASLREATGNLLDVVDGYDRTEPMKGNVSRLSDEEIGLVELEGSPDPAEANGFYIVNVFPCTLDKLEPILYSLDQASLYDGAYDAYDRRYTSELAPYKAREVPSLSWISEMTSTLPFPFSSTYTEQINGGLRWVPAAEEGEEEGSVGPVLLSRVWLPRPAVFEEGEDKAFDQDYQIEIYVERAPGEILHAYGFWRHMSYGGGLDTESDTVIGLMLQGMIDWDERTAENCAK